MPIYNTTLIAPVSKSAPTEFNPVSRESTTLGAAFGEILGSQNQLLPQGEAPSAVAVAPIAGGNVLHSGGKNLPDLLANATADIAAATFEAATLAPATPEAATLAPATLETATLAPVTPEAATLAPATREAAALTPTTVDVAALAPAAFDADLLAPPVNRVPATAAATPKMSNVTAELTSESAAVAIAAPPLAVDAVAVTADPNVLDKRLDVPDAPVVAHSPLPHTVAEPHKLEPTLPARQLASATTAPEGSLVAAQLAGSRAASVQIARADAQPQVGDAVRPATLAETIAPMIRSTNTGTGSEQAPHKGYLDAGLQARQAQLIDSTGESTTRIFESLVGQDLSQAKVTAPTSQNPVASTMAPPIVQTEAGVAVKMASGSAMTATMTPGGRTWSNEFAGRVSMVVKNGLQEASIQLNPPELGRLEVKISTEGDQAKILFNVQNVAAKDAIEQAMPRLREMLEEGGLQLAHSEVADHSRSQHHDGDEPANVTTDSQLETFDENIENSSSGRAMVSSDSLVDYYI